LGDAVERRLQGGVRIGVGLLVEADMAVADLDEGEPVHRCAERLAAEAETARHAARHRPDDTGAGPGHAFEEPAPARASVVGLLRIHDVRSFASSGEAEIGGSADLFAPDKKFRMAGINRRPRRSYSERRAMIWARRAPLTDGRRGGTSTEPVIRSR